MEHKTRTKALSWLLSLALMLSLLPGMSLTAYADESMVGRYFRTPGNGATETIEFTGTSPIYLSGVTKNQTLNSNSVQWKRQAAGSYWELYFNGTKVWRDGGLPLGIYFASGSGTQSDPYVTVWNNSRGNGTKLSAIYPHDTLGGVDVLAKTDSSITLGTVANDRWVKVTTGDNTAYTKLSESENTVLNELSADTTFGVYGRFKVTYNKGEAESGTEPTDSTQYQPGTEVTVLGKNDLAKAGYVFKEWNTRADGNGTAYQPGATFTSDTGLTLYAIWEFSQNSVAITLPGDLTLGDGWTASDGITAAVGADGFPDGKQVTVTAESANDWNVKLDESNSVGYAAYSEESDTESITSWVFSSDDLKAGKTLPAGFKLTLPAEAQKGIYTDSITFKAAIDTPAPEYANQLVYVGNSSNTSLPNGATEYGETYKGAQLTAEQGKALAVYLANKTGKKSVVAYASKSSGYRQELCLAKSDGTTFTGALYYRLSDWGVSGWEFYYVSTTAQSSGGASEPEAVIELGAVSVKCYVHAHSFTYTADGDTITVTCGSSDGYCYLPAVDGIHAAKLTIAAPAHTNVGDGKSAEAVITDENQIQGTATVSYYAMDASGNKTSSALTEAPTAAGTYWAEITLGADSNTATAHVVYEITNPEYNITLPTDLVGGTVTAKANDTEVTKAKYNNTVTLTASPNEHYHFNSFTVKDSDNNPVEVSGDGDTRTFTMPASDVTVTAEFEGDPFTVTVAEQISNGTVTVASTLENGKAKAGSEVTLTVTPDAGYALDTLSVVTTEGSTEVPVTNNKFTMPTEAVTVTATFVGKPVTASLSVTGNTETTCTAELLNDDFTPVTGSLTKKAGERFILSLTTDEDYDYTVKFGEDLATSNMAVFTDTDYQAYAAYLDAHDLEASATTDFFWVTMPGVAGSTVNVSVTFAKVKAFTVLYQPATSVNHVWCKFTDSENRVYVAEMQHDLNMNGVVVWSASIKSAFVPTSVAFISSNDALTQTAIESATTMTTISNTTSGSFQNVTGSAGDKCMVIGGNAKTVAAAFVDEKNNTLKIEIAVCPTDNDGNVTGTGTVTAPAAPTKDGFTFKGWRGFQFDGSGKASEKIYTAGESVPVRENTSLSAVWDPVTPTVKLDPNNGGNIINIPATYGDPVVKPENIENIGFILENWKVGKSVTESGTFFPQGSNFDFNTGITSDLELNAQWKHVHSYTSVPLNYSGFNGALDAYSSYLPYLHVDFCGCNDLRVVSHTFNEGGVCTGCGYTKPGATEAKLQVFYWKNGEPEKWMAERERTVKIGDEVNVSAYWQIDDYQFSKWQYSTDSGVTWNDLAATTMVGFIVPCSMQVRALYVSTITEPQLSLSARNYVTQAQGYNWDSVLFQMEYKLPDGYTLVDAGVRMGDNNGISYYEMKEYKGSAGQKAAIEAGLLGFNIAWSFIPSPGAGGAVSDYIGDKITGLLTGDDGYETVYYYEKRENSVLDLLTAEDLAEYMLKFKPVNVEKYPPIYWESKVTTKNRTGSVNTLTPLRFIQKNNGNHYIYGMAYLTYQDSAGVQHTIYTEAIPVTRDNIPNYTAKATPSGRTH